VRLLINQRRLAKDTETAAAKQAISRALFGIFLETWKSPAEKLLQL
jgi:hypothetical protein